jgi:hypothetical protein
LVLFEKSLNFGNHKTEKETLEENKWKKFILLCTAIYAYYLIGICNTFFIYLAPT